MTLARPLHLFYTFCIASGRAPRLRQAPSPNDLRIIATAIPVAYGRFRCVVSAVTRGVPRRSYTRAAAVSSSRGKTYTVSAPYRSRSSSATSRSYIPFAREPRDSELSEKYGSAQSPDATLDDTRLPPRGCTSNSALGTLLSASPSSLAVSFPRCTYRLKETA